MSLQYITDNKGKRLSVVIPIKEWEGLKGKYDELKNLEGNRTKQKIKLSDFAGTLSDETADAMLKDVADSRNEWEARINNITNGK